MSRPRGTRAVWVVALLLASACQDYNFNPVGHCLIQPGTQRVTLSNVSTADVLFVVDDSGSMGGEQVELADNFDAFINNLNNENLARANRGLQPIDFHLAVTTTAVFHNRAKIGGESPVPWTCKDTCTGASGLVCCKNADDTPALGPKRCSSDAECGGGTTCRTDCTYQGPFLTATPRTLGLFGERVCCDPTTKNAPLTAQIPCSRAGVGCGSLERHYDIGSCPAGVGGWPYPHGDFFSITSGATPNPRVLHFDKELYPNPPNPAATNKQGFTSAQLIGWFKENVKVGTCGSGQEQALQAGRLAVQKALAGQQTDTRNAAGGVTWDPATRTASSAARWPNATSKLVVVFVGDEDDCASPEDPSGGVVMLAEPTGADACFKDATTAAPLGGKEFPVSEFVDYFTGLGRTVAAGFILPAAQQKCSLTENASVSPTIPACTSESQCCPPTGCSGFDGAQARGIRLLEAAQALSARGVDVVAGSICDPNFGDLMDDLADIVKPPRTLSLPTLPAEDAVTLLRIAASSGETRKICGRPLEPRTPTNYTLQEAQATGADWWFTLSKEQPGGPVAVSQIVYINPNGSCIANPGETYSADYLGRLPAGGCQTRADCASALGGRADAFPNGDWSCFAGVNTDQTYVQPTSSAPGTCVCGGDKGTF